MSFKMSATEHKVVVYGWCRPCSRPCRHLAFSIYFTFDSSGRTVFAGDGGSGDVESWTCFGGNKCIATRNKGIATRSKGIATRSKGLTTSNKKLIETIYKLEFNQN